MMKTYAQNNSLILDKDERKINKIEKTQIDTIIDRISSPFDLKQLSITELEILAEEIRQLIIDTVSENGGHLASSLGAIELAIALHHVFDTPRDKIIWDVGHQAYAHKILTGRKEKFTTLRLSGGLSGFPKRNESEYDVFGTGHSSTSISAALGIARANRLKNQKNKVIAVIGDGALMSGIAFEGLNHAGHLKEDLIVVLNDNGTSIARNVGALSESLSRMISGHAFNKFRQQVKNAVQRIPGIGQSLKDRLRKSEGLVKGLFMPGLIFHELGFLYIGPVPGHRLDLLVQSLKNLLTIPGPLLIHVVTKKGKGYAPAEHNPTLYHGVPGGGSLPLERTAKKSPPHGSCITYTEGFGKALLAMAEKDARIIAITAGMTHGTGLEQFEKKFPDRFYDVGIAEQHAVTFAAGMAVEGFRPVVAIYSTFLQRAYDQILHDVCLQNLPVVFMLDRAGIVGEDGPTHHGMFDISYLRHIPNLVIMAPKNVNELQDMLYTALQLPGPAAIRYPRGYGEASERVPDSSALFHSIPLGSTEVVKAGRDAAILAIGSTVYPSIEAADLLDHEGIHCTVINSRFIKPIDKEFIFSIAQAHPFIFTVEENVLQGGFGSAVLEVIASYPQLRGNDLQYFPHILCIGIPDKFVAHGTQKELRSSYGLDSRGIYNTVKKNLQSNGSSAT